MRLEGKGDEIAHVVRILKLGVYLPDEWVIEYSVVGDEHGDKTFETPGIKMRMPFTLEVTAVKGKNSSRRALFVEIPMEYVRYEQRHTKTMLNSKKATLAGKYGGIADELWLQSDLDNALDDVQIRDKSIYTEITKQCSEILDKAIEYAEKHRKSWQD